MDLQDIEALSGRIREQIGKVVVGQEAAVDLLLVSLLSNGHVLLEGVPGTAKTLLSRTFAACLDLAFQRIQFTPDLMPGDVIGTNLFNFQTNRFVLTKGPIFTELLLADEINRTPPKTQAALLQAMQEHAVTVDNESYSLGPGFMVVATQNPIEQQGTYPLPEAQLDRFLFKILIEYPERDDEVDMVHRHGRRTTMPDVAALGVAAISNLAELTAARAGVRDIGLGEPVVDYIVDLVRTTRQHPALQFGASPRAATMLASASRSLAALSGRDYVIPDDVKTLIVPLLRHRVVLAPGAEIEGLTPDQVIAQTVDQVPAPR